MYRIAFSHFISFIQIFTNVFFLDSLSQEFGGGIGGNTIRPGATGVGARIDPPLHKTHPGKCVGGVE